MFYVFYDIRDPKRLKKISKCLQRYGLRVQKSVFFCEISVSRFEKLKRQLQKLQKPEDKIMYLEKCRIAAENITGK